MELNAPWVRLLTRCLQWSLLLIFIAQIVDILWRRRRARATWEGTLYFSGILALVWSPEILAALRRSHPRAGVWATDVFLFSAVCWIGWMTFGPGRREKN